MIKEKAVFPMMKHTELINYVAEKIKAKTYLELGVYNTAHNFDRVNVEQKIGVDPDETAGATYKMDSDWFFLNHSSDYKSWTNPDGSFQQMATGKHFDVIFCDGLHHADQVRRDIINSWHCLSSGGVLIIHDTNPHSEHITHVPRDNREWCGTVYKAIFQINEPEKFTIKDDYGITVIRKTGELKMNDGITNWEEFDMFRDEILNLKTWEEGIKIIDSWK